MCLLQTEVVGHAFHCQLAEQTEKMGLGGKFNIVQLVTILGGPLSVYSFDVARTSSRVLINSVDNSIDIAIHKKQ